MRYVLSRRRGDQSAFQRRAAVAYFGALNEAVDLINGDFGRYAHYITAITKGRLAPEELGKHFVHYIPVETYAQEKFDSTYQWMRSRVLSAGQNSHATLIAG